MKNLGIKNLEYKREVAWYSMDDVQKNATDDFSKGYIDFLNKAKTERECVREMTSIAKAEGFVDFQDVIDGKATLKAGLKIYWTNREKAMMMAIIGKENPINGLNMVGAHIDAPRLDFRPQPLYEDHDMALAKTHYYGGIKKYQWVSVPLALHGVVCKKDGTKIIINIGEEADDPIFVINDLLPHLAYEQIEKKASDVISAEGLNLVMGSLPYYSNDPEDAKGVKANVLRLLNEKYGISERDFNFAEIEIVPALPARYVGLDKGMIGGYAQDDKVCAYTAFKALLEIDDIPAKTCACYFSDREEVGSMGNTGARANWLENFFFELCNAYSVANDGKIDIAVAARRSMTSTAFLSADVTAAFDPNFPEVSEPMNTAYCGMGIAFEKYTGHRGKSGASEASCEFFTGIAKVLDDAGIPWQLTEMGKLDKGGGGTIAQYMTDLGMDVIDCGTPVLSMHSPYEVTSKVDVYWTYKAYLAFFMNY
ncbi:MAG: aminopeptidase [Clostridia bacterium]|nr:aminopeptidase [Clostridia bacterium]